MPKIAIAAINIFRHSPEFKEYAELSARGKIDKLVKRIELICEKFKSEIPTNVSWIIGWREHGVFEPQLDFKNFPNAAAYKLPLSVETKAYLQEEMKKIIVKYPKLTILAGTIAVERSLQDSETKISSTSEKLDKINNRFSNFAWMEQLEKESADEEITKERKRITAFKKSDPKVLRVVSNTSYIFTSEPSRGEEVKAKMITRRKASPFCESALHQIFRPASSRTHQPQFQIYNQTTNETLSFGLEICREHYFGPLKRQVAEKPLVHFILSDTIYPLVKHVHGHYAVLLDSKASPSLISTEEKPSTENAVLLYEHDLLTENSLVRGPLQPFYPLNYQLRDKLEDIIRENNATIGFLKNLRDRFNNNKKNKQPDAYESLKQDLMESSTILPLLFSILNTELKNNPKIDFKKFISNKIIQKIQDGEGDFSLLIRAFLNTDFISHTALHHLKEGLKEMVRPFVGLFTTSPQNPYFLKTVDNLLKFIKDHEENPNSQYLPATKPAPLMDSTATACTFNLVSRKF